MWKLCSTLLVLATLWGTASAFRTDEDLQEVVARAIKAHGADAKLARRAYSLKLKGRYFADDKVVEASGSVHADGPGRARTEIKTSAWEIIEVLDGGKGWIRERNMTR